MDDNGGDDLGIPGLGSATWIGEGGNATVYRCRQDSLDRDVAVKLLKRAADEATLRRFRREQRAMGRMSQHEGIVTVYDSGVTLRGEPYLVMPLLERSLDDELKTRGSVPWREAVELIADIADTVQFAHDDGVVHRDIKPANIMRSRSGRPLVADFGISSIIDHEASLHSTAISLTPAYSPPESFEGTDSGPLADVYSLGATLYALLEGHPPYVDPAQPFNLLALVRRIADEPAPEFTHDVPSSVQAIIAESMQKDPDHRIASARELSSRLRADLPATPVGSDETVQRRSPRDDATTVVVDGLTPSRIRRPLAALGAIAAVVVLSVVVWIVVGPDQDTTRSLQVTSSSLTPTGGEPSTSTIDISATTSATTSATAPAPSASAAPLTDLIPIALDSPLVEVRSPAVLTDEGHVLFPQDEAGEAAIQFTAKTSGNYLVWARVRISPDVTNLVNSNSLYVVEGENLPRSNEFVWDFWENLVFPEAGAWEWDRISRRGATGTFSEHDENPFIVAGRLGQATVFILGGRETGVAVERIYVTNDSTWQPPDCAASIVCSSRRTDVGPL